VFLFYDFIILFDIQNMLASGVCCYVLLYINFVASLGWSLTILKICCCYRCMCFYFILTVF